MGGALKRYREDVMRAALRRDGHPIYNGSLEHAEVLVEQLFASANSQVSVFTGKLNPRVFASRRVLEKVGEFLGKAGCKVRILIDDPDAVDWLDHGFVRHFRQSDDLTFKRLDEDVSSKINFHFIVADDDCYRFESDKHKPEAIASFGDKVGGERLSGVFQELWNEAIALDPLDRMALTADQ